MATFSSKAPVSSDKTRGGYYTPPEIARFVAEWVAVAGPRALEPSCGDGNILRELSPLAADTLGVELVPTEAAVAREFAPVHVGSFFDWFKTKQHGAWDGVAGNPPYIRFGNWDLVQRAPALALMEKHGLKPSRLTNAWVPFVVASTVAVRDGGRVGLVIPAELLQVGYAAQLREYLLGEYSEITLVTFEKLVFEGVLQEVVLFLGVKGKGPAHMRTVEAANADALASISLDAETAPTLLHDHEKWTKYFLGVPEIEALREIRTTGSLRTVGEFAEVNVGVVTGRNSFFTLSDADLTELKLGAIAKPLVSRSAQLRGVTYTDEDRAADLDSSLRTWILDSPADLADQPAMAAHVVNGEKENVHLGYKCSIRSPWWITPSMWVPDAFLLRQIHMAPRMAANLVGATSTDTVHRVRTREGVDAKKLSVAFTNSATFAFTETMGRSYGGGILELEPRESVLLPIPDPSLVSDELVTAVDELLKAGQVEAALDAVDDELLLKGLDWDQSRVDSCRRAWVTLRNRRNGRGKASR